MEGEPTLLFIITAKKQAKNPTQDKAGKSLITL